MTKRLYNSSICSSVNGEVLAVNCLASPELSALCASSPRKSARSRQTASPPAGLPR
jgi:hypothetical protein